MSLRRLASIVVLLVFLTVALAVGASSEATENATADSAAVKTPAVVIPKLHHQFEAVVDGTEITHAFAIQNTGDGPLAIQQVKTG